MRILNPPVVTLWEPQCEVRCVPELPPIETDEADRRRAAVAAELDRFQDIRGLTACAQSHDDIPGLYEILELSREDVLITFVVCVRSQQGSVVRQRDRPEPLFRFR